MRRARGKHSRCIPRAYDVGSGVDARWNELCASPPARRTQTSIWAAVDEDDKEATRASKNDDYAKCLLKLFGTCGPARKRGGFAEIKSSRHAGVPGSMNAHLSQALQRKTVDLWARCSGKVGSIAKDRRMNDRPRSSARSTV